MEEKPDITKEKILEEAAKLFSRFGMDKTTMEDVAGAVRMGKSSLYYYFKNKDELFSEIINREAETYKQEMTATLESHESCGDKLKAYATTRMQIIRKLANTFQTFTDEYLKHYDLIQKLRAAHDAYETRLILEILKQGIGTGEFRIRNPALTAKAIFAGAKGLEYEWATSCTPEEIRENTVQLFDLLLHGILSK
jgi:AcrR family transcriptional regulator